MSDVPPPYQQPYPSTPPPTPPASSKGFFGALFDFGFNSFVTPMIVKVVYVLAVIGLGIGYLIFLIAGFAHSAGEGIAVLILGAIGVIIYLALIRMTLEFYISIVRMSEDIHRRLPPA